MFEFLEDELSPAKLRLFKRVVNLHLDLDESKSVNERKKKVISFIEKLPPESNE